MAALPFAKLFFLGIRQASKPFASLIKTSARESEFVRTKVLQPIGQGSHWVTVMMKRLTLDSKRRDVKPLDPAEAVAAGAELIGEVFVYSVAALIVINEYLSSAAKSAEKEAKQTEKIRSLVAALEIVEQRLDELQETQTQLLAQTEDMAIRLAAVTKKGKG
eukprot:m.257382 g.257382  ORF g.257382 m.257382 type:complete len:162 (+) comp22707_c0_seq7:2421-2906(+)